MQYPPPVTGVKNAIRAGVGSDEISHKPLNSATVSFYIDFYRITTGAVRNNERFVFSKQTKNTSLTVIGKYFRIRKNSLIDPLD